MKILLVEDEEKMVALLQRGLTEEGHTVDVCTEGRAALERGAQDGYGSSSSTGRCRAWMASRC